MTTKQNETAMSKPVIERREEALTAIACALAALGHVWERRDGIGVTVDGVPIYLVIAEESSDWRRGIGNGRLRLRFGDYGQVRQFPEPKTGFDTTRIAGEISRYVKERVAQRRKAQDAEMLRRDARARADAINAELGLHPYSGPRATVDPATNGIAVELRVVCSEATARTLLAAVKESLSREPARG